jgi:hypothetical protein
MKFEPNLWAKLRNNDVIQYLFLSIGLNYAKLY